MIKIVFFDVDGTLLKMGCKELSDKTIYALNKLKENGIKIFIATGRPSSIAPYFNEVKFDGLLSFSGQLCEDEDGVIYKNNLNQKDVVKVYQNSKEMGIPIMLADQYSCALNRHGEQLDQYLKLVNVDVEQRDDFDQYVTHEIYQIVAAIPKEKEEVLLKGTTHLQSTRWCDIACDIIPTTGGKEIGIQKILEHYGYSVEESMSFGDGGNDKTMLEYTGIGVAMGNAVDEVKSIADYTTLPVEQDGVYEALKHFKLID